MKETLKTKIIDVIIFCYRAIFLRKSLLRINKFIFFLSLRGIGILNYEDEKVSGEEFFLKKLSSTLNNSVVLDVGANLGKYSNFISTHSPQAKIYAFEPHPQTFTSLKNQAEIHKYIALNIACGDVPGNAKLYDYENKGGTSHASLYQDVIEKIHKVDSGSWDIEVTTVDEFIKDYKIQKIALLKIDTEGNELKVIKGAEKSIASNIIDIIHFEFNEMNVVSRVFFRDISQVLNNYLFFRLLPNGLISMGEYNPLYWEIFAYQNIIAINKDFFSQAEKHFSI